MNGHGWVVPNPDGRVARCGGPGICKVCQSEQMALTTTTDSRARFEKWAKSKGYDLDTFVGGYFNNDTSRTWEAWRAALSAQPPSVVVGDIEKLDRWDVFAECGHNGSGYVEKQVYEDGEFIRYADLRNLIKANEHE